jgi:antitoxin (DNA-binding transcriptional repressor) of toxin-antitoxin stability system
MIRIREIGFKSAWAVTALALLALGACGREDKGWRSDPATAKTEQVSLRDSYLKPPGVVSAVRQGDAVALSGQAEPLASVTAGRADRRGAAGQGRRGRRLAAGGAPGRRTPALRPVDDNGGTHRAGSGLSDGRAERRGGAAAGRGRGRGDGPKLAVAAHILAIDYDRSGGGVISGVGAPGAGLGVRVDRVTRGEGKVDEDGRFSISLDQPLAGGTHVIQVAGEGGEQQVVVDVSPPTPPTGGPASSTLTARAGASTG